MNGGDDILLGVRQAVDEQQREHVLARPALAIWTYLPFEAAHGLRRALDAEALDVGDHLAVHAEFGARKGDEQQAALHHAGRADLASGRAPRDRNAGELLAERSSQHVGIVVDAEEGNEVLEFIASEPRPGLDDGLAGRRQRAGGNADTAVARRGLSPGQNVSSAAPSWREQLHRSVP